MLESVLPGLTLGAISSFHCVGMCGPIALSLPVQDMRPWKQTLSTSLYHTGRIFTYISLGFVVGLAGKNLELAGFQQNFSLISGALLLILSLRYFLSKQMGQPKFMQSFNRRLTAVMHYALQLKSSGGFFLLGSANGLLPCGMVYIALAAAVNAGSLQNSMLFMGSFGLGTFPAMMAIGLLGFKIKLSIRQKMRNLFPYIMSAMGLLLILRGLNLGIPFISPELLSEGPEPVICH